MKTADQMFKELSPLVEALTLIPECYGTGVNVEYIALTVNDLDDCYQVETIEDSVQFDNYEEAKYEFLKLVGVIVI